jgi:uncharacterized membrane protein YfcA
MAERPRIFPGAFCHYLPVLIIEGLIAGALIGSVLGFIGAGGAMLSVPILIYGFDFSASHASTAALAVVLLAAASGLVPKFKSKDVLVKEALIISGLGLTTNISTSLIAHRLSERFILTGFSLVLLVAGSSMLLKPIDNGPERKMPAWVLVLVSLVIGSMTGLFGIGGGFLAIPVLVLFFRVPQNKAAGTSLLIIALNSIAAFLGHYKIWSEVSWGTPLAMAISAVIVAQLASGKSAHVSPVMLKRAFAVLLFSISAITLLNAWVF